LQINQLSCADDVLDSIAGGGSDLSQVLDDCPMPVMVDEK
jgi:hypothetical protein